MTTHNEGKPTCSEPHTFDNGVCGQTLYQHYDQYAERYYWMCPSHGFDAKAQLSQATGGER